MQSLVLPSIKGFDFKPLGGLLEQVVDFTRPMGFAYERSCEFYKDFHTHDSLMLVFPRGACVMEVRTMDPKRTFKIDSDTFLTVPKNLIHDDEGKSSIYDTMALYPSEKQIQAAAKVVGASAKQLKDFFEICKKLDLTPWLKQLCLEYFSHRVLNKSASRNSLNFFENQILCEVFRIHIDKKSIATFAPSDDSSIALRAIQFIETSLFSPMTLEQIANHCGASISTLNRYFSKETGKTTYNYIKHRRLDEAMKLLKDGDYTVSQVALLVGYENFGAFTDAFKQRFGKLPSKV